jgi:hypothetical protein
MRKLIIFIMMSLVSGFASAQNTSLDLNAENCSKVKGWSSHFDEGVSAAIGVSVRDLDFRRAKFGVTCDFVVSTPKGMYLCMIPVIIQPSDKKRNVFAGGYYGPTDCRKTTVVN